MNEFMNVEVCLLPCAFDSLQPPLPLPSSLSSCCPFLLQIENVSWLNSSCSWGQLAEFPKELPFWRAEENLVFDYLDVH